MLDWDARLAKLQSHWKTAATAAKDIGYIKPDDISWDEAAIAIVEIEKEKAENKEADAIANIAEMPRLVIKGVYPTAWYKANNIPVCALCGEQLLSDGRSPICAENFPANVCPRLSGEHHES